MLLILASIVSWHGGARVASRRGEVRMAAGTYVPSIIYNGGGRIGSLMSRPLPLTSPLCSDGLTSAKGKWAAV